MQEVYKSINFSNYEINIVSIFNVKMNYFYLYANDISITLEISKHCAVVLKAMQKVIYK